MFIDASVTPAMMSRIAPARLNERKPANKSSRMNRPGNDERGASGGFWSMCNAAGPQDVLAGLPGAGAAPDSLSYPPCLLPESGFAHERDPARHSVLVEGGEFGNAEPGGLEADGAKLVLHVALLDDLD